MSIPFVNTPYRYLAIAPEYIKAYFATLSSKFDSSYKDRISAEGKISIEDIPIAYNFDSSAPDNSIAVHYIHGVIRYNSYWWFSTAEFANELKVAEENPNILAHVIIINSPGGETFYLHEAAMAIRNLQKPVISIIDTCGCSAAYWLASAANKVYATSPLSTIGSIGVMTTLYDDSGYYEKEGIKITEVYATNSKNKNKRINDALEGKTKALIEKELDPVMDLFEKDVRAKRKKTADDVYTGDSYYAQQAKELGLIDGVMSIEDVIVNLYNSVNFNILRNNINSLF